MSLFSAYVYLTLEIIHQTKSNLQNIFRAGRLIRFTHREIEQHMYYVHIKIQST